MFIIGKPRDKQNNFFYGYVVIAAALLIVITAHGAQYTFGPVLAGSIFDMTGSYSSAFLTCTAVGITGIILSALLRPPSG